NSEFRARSERVEQALQVVNELGDKNARASALELMQALMDLHGAAMTRIVELLSESTESGHPVLLKIADDPLISGLLVLYGVHPFSLRDRVQRALERLVSQLRKLGCTLELVNADENVVRINLGNAPGDAHSVSMARNKIEQAIREAAPEVVEI